MNRCLFAAVPGFCGIILSSGVGSPVSAAPSIAPMETARVPAGKTLIVPILGESPEGERLVYRFESSDPDVTVYHHTGNPHMKMTVAGFGDLVFELFEDRAPKTARTIGQFAQSGYYDGLTFHRVISNFMIQGGDPLGTGGGGPSFRFDDEFHPDAIFSGRGQLAMANSGRDTNGSQFFVTVVSPRFLDFNHTILGQLIRGFDVLDTIKEVPTFSEAPMKDRPQTPVVIERAGLVPNLTDAVITLKAANTAGSTAVITVIATDDSGRETRRDLQVETVADETDDPPILGLVQDRTVAVNGQLDVTLSAVDLEGDEFSFAAAFLSSPSNASGSIDGDTMSIIPDPGFSGAIEVLVGVAQVGATVRGSSTDVFDKQTFVIAVGDEPISAEPMVVAASRDVGFDNVPLASFVDGDSGSAADEFTAMIRWGDGTETEGTVAALNAGGYEVRGSHRFTRDGEYQPRIEIQGDGGARVRVESRIDVAPEISASFDDGDAVLRWPAWTLNYVLERQASNDGWSAASGTRRIEGYDVIGRFPVEPGVELFRLRRP